ncbi:beta-galactosidase-1-like protein 3 isoform X2 [Mastomys coucha]|uniref:beta-galactosidase-1-like protein 3 isoform X2 n=1 Tax=Mastomys coucha TaxID=35658 RepID=UPI001262A1F8|nr:beta-galactosidase-1-like protein 3 isoform X2 [Mastomys coucha]
MAYLSKQHSWKRIMAIFFLPLVLSGFAPRSQGMFKSPARFSWSHLSPSKLKNRSEGLSTKTNAQGKAYFTLEGHKFMIVGGSIHYFRVPREYWKDRLLKLQACGFNTVTTYIPWNLHEQERGKFDFSEILDLEAYVLLAETLGLWVILRPGPYICAEVDLGGLPSWLLRDPVAELRTTNEGFIDAVDKYFDHLIPKILPLQYRHGGPVIAVQVENEYGSFKKDRKYMDYMKKALLKRGIVELLLTSDDKDGIQTGSVDGALTTINMHSFIEDSFIKLHQMQNDKPIMIMEFWTGWYDSWGSKHIEKSANEIQHTVYKFIRYGLSFNMYMFHGGTNFGFINGGHYEEKHIHVVTSYDYDAVLSEAGDYTEKYFMLRKLFASGSAHPLPPLPPLIPKAVYPSVNLSFYLPLFDILPYLNEPVMLHTPVTMENLPINSGSGQPFGLVLYETSICFGGSLFASVHDSAQVFLNDRSIGILDENNEFLQIPKIQGCQLLRILVENQGRINFSWRIQNEQKGLNKEVSINGTLLRNFTIYSLDMKMSFFKRLRSASWKLAPKTYKGPAFYWGILNVGSSPTDTFLHLPNWHYGFVFINGRNLGRYWDIGPQSTLYLPGPWLHPEDNEVIVFEKVEKGFYIQTRKKPQLQKCYKTDPALRGAAGDVDNCQEY